MLEVKRSMVVVPGAGQYPDVRKRAIEHVKVSADLICILRGDGRLEVYRGTGQTKQRWFKITYDPGYKLKRPGIPQWKFHQDV